MATLSKLVGTVFVDSSLIGNPVFGGLTLSPRSLRVYCGNGFLESRHALCSCYSFSPAASTGRRRRFQFLPNLTASASSEEAIGVQGMVDVNSREWSSNNDQQIAERSKETKENDGLNHESHPFDSKDSIHTAAQTTKTAKIHDFCLGIPYGGILFAGGLLGFIITRARSALGIGMVGVAILALGFSSLNVWKQEKSCTPFIQSQAGIAALVSGIGIRRFVKVPSFPVAAVVLFSGAMVGFYCYVLLSGGNPKKKVKVKN